MREVKIGGKTYHARSLKRRERVEHKLDDYGYGRFFYSPPETPEGKIDRERAEKGIDLVLELVFGLDAMSEIDEADGMNGLAAAHMGIIKETYGAKDEEKNLPQSGAGPQTTSA